jgi:poly-gamma-glutamate capsule biosynthesis protein CapA/YwtB (metallophosphatase superfamily)
MLARFVEKYIERNGLTYPFSATLDLLQADLSVGNLESPLTHRRSPQDLRPGPYRLPADPSTIAALEAAGFDALSLANNHALDAGPEGLQEAVQVLEAAQIRPLGVGKDTEAARQIELIERNGLRIALLAANDVVDPQDRPDEGQNWGRAPLDQAFLERVRLARSQADLVIVLVHWGVEYSPTPSRRQLEQADKLVAAGADLIVGSHPHVLQPIVEREWQGRRVLIAFSLGNFIFDQPFSQATSQSAIVRIRADQNGLVDFAVDPLTIVNGQPRPLAASDPEYAQILHQLGLADQAQPEAKPSGETAEAHSLHRFQADKLIPLSALEADKTVIQTSQAISASLDLHGNGSQLLMELDQQGLARLHAGPSLSDEVVWQNEDLGWFISQIAPGDADNDGRYEFLLIVWKRDENGVLGCHPFLLGWRGGRYRIIWGGSALARPIQAALIADSDGDGNNELLVIEGGTEPHQLGDKLLVLRWNGWLFEQQAETSISPSKTLRLISDPTQANRLLIDTSEP